jgi:hypothetical protein
MLDEQALRLETFTGGTAILLADGQPWAFKVPTVTCYYPITKPDGGTALTAGYDLGAEYDKLTDRYSELEETDVIGQVTCLTDLAYFLLAQNYNITRDDLRHVLRLEMAPEKVEANRAMWSQIGDAALGRSPKAIPAGDAQS